MNIIESLQKKYLPGFYESRYLSRKTLALSLKDKCLKNPQAITIYELKIILKVLEQFKLLPKESKLEEQQKIMKKKIVENSVYSSVVSLLPFAVREFHKVKTGKKIVSLLLIFGGTNYALMWKYFSTYIQQCRNVVQKNIVMLQEESILPS